MKKLFFFVFALVCISNSMAQINFEQSYSNAGSGSSNFVSLVNIGKVGFKYVHSDQLSRTVKIYNLNHSLYLTATIAFNPSFGTPSSNAKLILRNVSSDVFDCDSSTIEYAFDYTDGPTRYFEVVRANGNILFHKDSFQVLVSQGFANPFNSFIVTTPSGTKMLISNVYNLKTDVYSLCGTLPLNVKKTGTSEDASMQLSPNPSTHQTRVEYTLPQGTTEGEVIITDVTGKTIQVFKVDVNFNHILLSNADLPSGTYYYQLHTKEAGTINTKKAIVIK